MQVFTVAVEQFVKLQDTVFVEAETVEEAYAAAIATQQNNPAPPWIVDETANGPIIPRSIVITGRKHYIAQAADGTVDVWQPNDPVPVELQAWQQMPKTTGLHWVKLDDRLLGCFDVWRIDTPTDTKPGVVYTLLQFLPITPTTPYLWRAVTTAEQAVILRGFPYE